MLTPRKFLWAFITEQSQGEWGEDTIRADIDLFMKMLEKEGLALVSADRIDELEGLASDMRVLLQAKDERLSDREARIADLEQQLAEREQVTDEQILLILGAIYDEKIVCFEQHQIDELLADCRAALRDEG